MEEGLVHVSGFFIFSFSIRSLVRCVFFPGQVDEVNKKDVQGPFDEPMGGAQK